MARDKKLIVGNWKMNFNIHEASMFVHKLSDKIKVRRDVEVVLAPTFLALQSVALQINHRQFKLASQDLYWRDEGAFTGEVSAQQLKGLVTYAIVGHSERRHIFGENDKEIRSKVQAALRNEIKPILCVGETAVEKSNGETKDVIADQILGGLANVTSEEIKNVVIAYEPVWSIGSGTAAKPEDVTAVARIIRLQVRHLYGQDAADELRVIYGGSVSTDTAAEYLNLADIDGLLIGGASLDVEHFANIVKKAHKPKSTE